MANATRTTRGGRRGFTLIELVLVIIIVGVISAIALPRFAQATARQQLDAAADRVAHDLAWAQAQARQTSNAVTVTFKTGQESYTVSPSFGTAYTVELDESPYQVKIFSAKFEDGKTVTFNGFGVPDASGQVLLKSSVGSETVFLDAMGRSSR